MKRLIIYLCLLASVLYSCNNSSIKSDSASEEMMNQEEISLEDVSNIDANKVLFSTSTSNETPSLANNLAENSTLKTNKIIRKGNLSIESKDVKSTKKQIDNYINKVGGYYEQESTSAGSTYINLNLSVRIPSEKFDEFINSIENGEDKITNKSITAEDVSLQYYDVESRIKSKRAYLEQYQKMVASAKNVEDLLKIQEQIRQLQEDIESSKSVFNTLANQISYSTITIDIYHNDASGSAYSVSFFSEIKDSFVAGWELIKNIFLGIITIWPIIIGIGLIILAWKKYKRSK